MSLLAFVKSIILFAISSGSFVDLRLVSANVQDNFICILFECCFGVTFHRHCCCSWKIHYFYSFYVSVFLSASSHLRVSLWNDQAGRCYLCWFIFVELFFSKSFPEFDIFCNPTLSVAVEFSKSIIAMLLFFRHCNGF